MLSSRSLLAVLLALFTASLAARQEPIDRAMVERIRQQGPQRSRVMEFFSRFVTVDGPRLTGSPAHKASADWARQQFSAMGLQGAQLEPIQDYVNYDIRTHHTNMDTFERVQEKDMAQSAVVFASFAWHAAMRTEKFSRPTAAPSSR